MLAGEPIQLHTTTVNNTLSSEPIYIPILRNPDESTLGNATVGVDTSDKEKTFEIDGEIGDSAEEVLPSVSAASQLSITSNGNIEVLDQSVTFYATNYRQDQPIGMVNIVPGTFTLKDGSGTTFTEGTDYEVDLARGRVEILPGGSMSYGTEYFYDAVMVFNKRNVARLIEKMEDLGGFGVYAFDYYDMYESVSGQSALSEHTVLFNSVTWTKDAGRPKETSVSIELREAVSQ